MSDIQKTTNPQVTLRQELTNLRNLFRQESFRNSSRLLDHETFIQRFKTKETPATDAELIAAYTCNGNELSFDKLYKRHKPKMLAYIYTILHDNDDCQDVLHNAWEKVLIAFKNKKYLESQDFGGWFKSICYREAGIWNREKKRFLHGNENMPDREDRSLNALEHVVNQESDLRLHKYLHMLTKTESIIVQLYVIEGRSNKEIARKLKINQSTVRVTYRNALLKLRQLAAKEL